MEQDKPFKTIEVVDGNTKQLCKIACMSCIRGHRTTSCGIPVCRPKIFWTVKRPGRPSNACTCRYSSTGGCKCVTAVAKCPHKSKKGEKRTSECRCDEQGRFCCFLEPEHWEALMALKKPVIDFYPSREDLEATHLIKSPDTAPSTPAYFPPTPQQTGSCCGTPGPAVTTRTPRSIAPSLHDSVVSPNSTSVTPRFGFMGVGGPMGDMTRPDVLAWNSDVPVAPREYHPIPAMRPLDDEPVMSSCCQARPHQPQNFSLGAPQGFPQVTSPLNPSYTNYPTMPSTPAVFDIDRWNQNYYNYQFPNAICQSCGLNGCTCRSCPPVMQNFGTTSWAQCCGRKHARIESVPILGHQPQAQPMTIPGPAQSMPPEAFAQPVDLMDIDGDFTIPADADPLAYSEFLMHELDRPSHTPGEDTFGG